MTQTPPQAQPALAFIPPQLSPVVLQGLNRLLPLILRKQTAVVKIETHNLDRLLQLYQQFDQGQVRFMLAFRHPSTDDPICLGHVLWRSLPQLAKQRGVKLARLPHAHFIYDRGIPLWAGKLVGWLLAHLGCTPIQRGKLDRVGLKSARDLFFQGVYPMAAAPEGATNGHTEVIGPLEPGVSQLGFWCAEDLHKAQRSQQVLIVPVGIRYRYISPPWSAIDNLMADLEKIMGLAIKPTADSIEDRRYERLATLASHLLGQMETFYARFYHRPLAPLPEGLQGADHFSARLERLLDNALQVAEQSFNLQPKGSVIDRCRRLEQSAWDCIYREDLKNPDALPPLDRGLANRIAEEASQKLWHMRLVETFVAVTGKYVQERPTPERYAESVLIMWNTVARITGGNPFNRPKLGPIRAEIVIGDPLSVSDRYGDYASSRKQAKQSLADLTRDLQLALEQML
jgi:1-acyl-sn-glycerol-3-phosphate acyltransferase